MDPVEFAPWRGVFETVRVSDGIPLFVLEHLAEFHRAAAALGLDAPLDAAGARAELPQASGRWRWLATPEGVRTLFSPEEPAPEGPWELSVSPLRVGSQNWDARFKTVSYLTHAQALQVAATPEVILLNEHRQVAGCARANLFWRRGRRLFTPSHETGCRQGVVRGFILQHRQVDEGSFPLDDLLEAEEIFLTNSLRGIVSVRAVEGRAIEADTAAERLRRDYAREVKRQIAEARRA
jgi:branched-subunit amino acid aminotransferase/4-amino-4-deoxychorismate lyase